MRKLLYVLIPALPCLLLWQPADSGDFLKITAPTNAATGELVELVADGADNYSWQVIPGTANIRVIEDGKKLFFTSGEKGDFLFILTGCKNNKINCLTHKLSIGGTVIIPFAAIVKSWLPKNLDPVILEKLARSFERVASAGHTDIAVLVKTTAASNRAILGKDLVKYTPFLMKLGAHLKANYSEKDISKHTELWFRIAAVLRSFK